MALTAIQMAQVAQLWAIENFVKPRTTAVYSTADIVAAAAAIDNAFDTTLNAAVVAVGGSTTIINGLAQVIPAPFSSASAAQKTLLGCYVLMKRAGVI